MTTPSRFAAVERLLRDALERRAAPAAAVEVGRRTGVTWRASAGRLTYEPDAPAADEDTIFDLASLTKVIATTSRAMRLVESRRLSLADRIGLRMSGWDAAERSQVTVRDLLEHCSGLPGWAPLFRDHRGRAAFETAIARSPLEYTPWTRSVYSDLGFILLGFVLDDAAGSPLDRELGLFAPPGIRFGVSPGERSRAAPTECDAATGVCLQGEVHDDNARALDGVAAHSGLFGTAAAVGAFARLVLQTFVSQTPLGTPETLRRFVTRSTVPGSSRALGWDTMLPTSSCGTRLSARSIGHTGFTGTSLWIDPERDLYVVLLSNRVHPTRENDRWRAVRPAVHDAIVEAVS